MQKKISVLFIPVASYAIALGYEENGKKYIVGKLEQQDLNDVEIEIKTLYSEGKKVVKKISTDIKTKYNNRKIIATSDDSINILESKLNDVLKNDTVDLLIRLSTDELMNYGYDYETAFSKAGEPYMNISNKLISYLQLHKRIDLTEVLIISLEKNLKYWQAQNNFK